MPWRRSALVLLAGNAGAAFGPGATKPSPSACNPLPIGSAIAAIARAGVRPAGLVAMRKWTSAS